MAKTLIGVFDDQTSAQNAIRALKAEGIPTDHVQLMDNSEAAAEVSKEDIPWTERIAHWFDLFEDDEDRVQANHYAEAWRRGHFIVVADVESFMVDRAASVMNANGAVDIKRRAEQWKSSGYTGTFDRTSKPYTPEQRTQELAGYQTLPSAGQQHTARPIDDTPPTGQNFAMQQAMPAMQEELPAGKRVVQRGGVHVHSYGQERPVEEQVRLREERIRAPRAPGNRPAAPVDMVFKERTVDMKAMDEVPVLEKETFRHRDVQVEALPSTTKTVPMPATTAKIGNGPRPVWTPGTQPESRR